MQDVSSSFVWNPVDALIGVEIAQHDGKPQAMKIFCEKSHRLTDYAYWFFLSTLWVSEPAGVALETWKRLYGSTRPDRANSIMKPSELRALRLLPETITAYRAHRPGERDWISYTTNIHTAVLFAARHRVLEIDEYRIKKADVLAYFLRRGEYEIILLDRSKAEPVRTIHIQLEKC